MLCQSQLLGAEPGNTAGKLPEVAIAYNVHHRTPCGFESASFLFDGRESPVVLEGVLSIMDIFSVFFTLLETSPLPMKSCRFWTRLGIHGN